MVFLEDIGFMILHSKFCPANKVENTSQCLGLQVTEYPPNQKWSSTKEQTISQNEKAKARELHGSSFDHQFHQGHRPDLL